MRFEETLTRRQFLQKLGLLGLQLGGMTAITGCLRRESPLSDSPETGNLHEARYYRELPKGQVQDLLCFKKCIIAEGEAGICLARENRGGRLYSKVYAKPVAVHIDPIEKEPMYHLKPGTDALCVGTAGCNFRCLYCINWHIAWKAPEEVEATDMSPAELVQTAIEHDVPTICFTYNDPIVLYEYMYDTFKLARESGLRTTFHSNGSMTIEPLKALLLPPVWQKANLSPGVVDSREQHLCC